ncbi:MAG: S1/P1 nuclease [Burkholderiaceae bacterium]|nr:S1/P1 nuclease [Burkholderiaceae bacterium]
MNGDSMRALYFLACVWSLAWHSAANAWGVQGHQVVAAIAQARLSPAAQQEVTRLLALEPGATLESVASWADQQRSPETAAWHYVNFPRGTCVYAAQRDCLGGGCVVDAIEQQAAVLRSARPDTERLVALKYLVHWVADVHQPLHAGHAEDRGGNRYQVQAFGQGSNLHAVWDSALLQALNEDTPVLAARLARQSLRASPVRAAAWTLPASSAQGWGAAQVAAESCAVLATPGFYPLDRQVEAAYLREFQPVLESRLALAGARLADVLNRLVGVAPLRLR